MDFTIPEELEMVQRTVKRFVDQELRPLEKQVEETDHIGKEVDRRLRRKAVELGLYGHNLPEAIGGGGLTNLGQALVGEELGRTTMALASTAGFLPGGVAHAKPNQRATLRALGLGRIGRRVEKNDSPQLRGMVRAVSHLVEVEEVQA